ncbi:hypothetical protein EG831_02365 [bacterium]|nr:hypothetical protein [bacterium]
MDMIFDLLDLMPEFREFELLLARLQFWTDEDGRVLADTLSGCVRDYAAGALDRAAIDELVVQARPVVDEWLASRPLVGRDRIKRLADELFAFITGELAQAVERRARAA